VSCKEFARLYIDTHMACAHRGFVDPNITLWFSANCDGGMRISLNFVAWKDRKMVAADLKRIY